MAFEEWFAQVIGKAFEGSEVFGVEAVSKVIESSILVGRIGIGGVGFGVAGSPGWRLVEFAGRGVIGEFDRLDLEGEAAVETLQELGAVAGGLF